VGLLKQGHLLDSTTIRPSAHLPTHPPHSRPLSSGFTLHSHSGADLDLDLGLSFLYIHVPCTLLLFMFLFACCLLFCCLLFVVWGVGLIVECNWACSSTRAQAPPPNPKPTTHSAQCIVHQRLAARQSQSQHERRCHCILCCG
jgi:hypothetical protein